MGVSPNPHGARMCGRFTLAVAPKTIAELFNLSEYPEVLQPRYNVAPTQPVAVVGLKPDGVSRGLRMIRWGLIPNWASDPKSVPNPFNARAEGIRDKPMFADRLDSGRGLIPAGGFYERLTVGKQKSPHHFRLRSGDAFAFAGLFDFWRSDDAAIFLTCLITTEANDVVKPVHDRMPVVLAGESEFSRWLDPAVHAGDVLPMLRPFPAGAMEVVRVGPAVGKATNQWPACIEPAVWSASLDSRVTKETSETNS